MALYSIDKLIEETRRLAAEFYRTTGTILPVSGEISRYDVSLHLNLTLLDQPDAGVDAIGNGERQGLGVQIKSRIIADAIKPGHRIGQLNFNGAWDLVILSLMDNEFEPFEMYQATRDELLPALPAPGSKQGKRGSISVAKFKIISQLVWTRELGTEDYHYPSD